MVDRKKLSSDQFQESIANLAVTLYELNEEEMAVLIHDAFFLALDKRGPDQLKNKVRAFNRLVTECEKQSRIFGDF